MKNSKKGKLINLVLVILLAILMVGCSKSKNIELDSVENKTYRSIIVSSISGDVTVRHLSDYNFIDAYEGMSLLNGDEVVVPEDGNMVLDVDSDKHLYVEPNTHFYLVAEGDENSDITKINLESGSILCQIQEKLKEGESFAIETVSSTMSVRGTVFRVSLSNNENVDNYEVVEVYDGKVWSNITQTNNSVVLEPGQCSIIKEGSDDASAEFVTADQVDNDVISDSGASVSVSNNDSNVLAIDYNKLSEEVISNLTTIVESGQELSISKEDLVKVSNGETVGIKKTPTPGIINENEFRSGSANDHICEEQGHTIITVDGQRQCAICGMKFSEEYHETAKDKEATKKAEESGVPMDIKMPEGTTTEIETGIPVEQNKQNEETEEKKPE